MRVYNKWYLEIWWWLIERFSNDGKRSKANNTK